VRSIKKDDLYHRDLQSGSYIADLNRSMESEMI